MDVIVKPLALLGRYGTQGFALSIFMGLALPQFAAAARPLLPITIFLFVAMTFARADLSALKAALVRPRSVIIAVTWLTVAPVLMMVAIFAVFPQSSLDPGLVLGLIVVAASPPIMSGPAVAMMLNIEPTVLIAATIITTAAAPFIGPPIAEMLLGGPAPIDAHLLMLRLLGLIGGAIVLALLARWIVGYPRIVANKVALDGFGVVMYFLFAIAAMDGVTNAFMTRPDKVMLFLGVAFAVVLAGFAIAWAGLRLFMKPSDVFLMGYGTAQRNMGAMIAALGAATPETTFLFFALAQFPIYLMPQLLKPIARRFTMPAAVPGEATSAAGGGSKAGQGVDSLPAPHGRRE